MAWPPLLETRAHALAYQLLYAGRGAPSLQDVATLTSSAPSILVMMRAYIMQNKGYMTLLDGILGANHQVLVAFHENFLSNLSHIIMTVDDEFGINVSSFLPLRLHHTHLAMGIFLQDTLNYGAHAKKPTLNELINLVCRRQWTLLPPLPSHYLDTELLASLAPNEGTTSLKRTLLEGDNGGKVENSQPVPHLANHFKAYGQPLHTLTHNNANNLPKSSNGEELCLSFHL